MKIAKQPTATPPNKSTDAVSREMVYALAKLAGGIQALASRAGLHRGNVSTWLRGEPTLGADAVQALRKAAGLRGRKLREDVVHTWEVDWNEMADEWLGPTLDIIPSGCKYVEIRKKDAKESEGEWRRVFAVYGPKFRLVVHTRSEFLCGLDSFFIERKIPQDPRSVILVADDSIWVEGKIGPAQFDQVLSRPTAVTWKDVEAAAHKRGMNPREVLSLVTNASSKLVR